MVTEAIRLPKPAAWTGESLTARARAASAEKLSPAPQMSTGLATGRVGTRFSVPSSMTSTPSAPCVMISTRLRTCRRSRL
jgi:hypothetical protein